MTIQRRTLSLLLIASIFAPPPAIAAETVLTVTTNQTGATPEILGYNSGHFYPGSNTRDWWRYSGVNGARIFMPSPKSSCLAAAASAAVTNQSSFLACREALRASPTNGDFLDWPAFLAEFRRASTEGLDHDYALHELHRLRLDICAQLGASSSTFPIAGTNDWPGKWRFWLGCYVQAFQLAREFDVRRFQYFNEPNHANAGGLTFTDYFFRLQLASDAFQSAVADANRLYGKSLKPLILAPVSAGSPDGVYPKWGRPLVESRHINLAGETDANFFLLHRYDYHEYNPAPERFGVTASNLNRLIRADTAPEPPLPLTVTEFNVHTAGKYLTMSETLDSPSQYPLLAAKTIELINNSVAELYCFKFSQTDYRLGIKKNGTHYVDNTNAPYNIGTITRAGEVWRLINKGFAANRSRLAVQASPGNSDVETSACFDPVSKKYFLLIANATNRTARIKMDFSAWNIPVQNRVLIEEVSEACLGGAVSWEPLPRNHALVETQPADSAWLVTVSALPEAKARTIPPAGAAAVRDGKYRDRHFEPGNTLRIQNNSTNADYRSAGFLQFHLPPVDHGEIQSAILTLHASSPASETAHAHIYAIKDSLSSGAQWSAAANLAQNIPPGIDFTNNFLIGAGDTAQLVGQVAAGKGGGEKYLDLTGYLRQHTNSDLNLLLLRQNGFYGDNSDSAALEVSVRSGISLQIVFQKRKNGIQP